MIVNADRVVLVNAWHDRNTGDSAISQGCIRLAKEAWPTAEIVVHTLLSHRDPAFKDWNVHLKQNLGVSSFRPSPFPEPRSTGRFRWLSVIICALSALLFDKASWLSWRYWAFRRELRGARALVMIGGSDVFDVSSSPTGRMRLVRVLAPTSVARAVGVPVFFWGHTLGPFETEAGRALAAKSLSSARAIFVREQQSAALAREFALAADVFVAPDLGFLMEPSNVHNGACRYLVLVPRRHILPGMEERTDRLVGELAHFARSLLDSGEIEEVLVVPQVTGPSAIEDDRTICAELAARIGREGARVYSGVVNPERLVDLYGGAQAVVAVRLHGAILALSAGAPAFAISYFTGKTEGVMNSVDAGDSWCEFDDVSSALLSDWWTSGRLHHDRAILSETISRMRADLHDIAVESRGRVDVSR